MELKDEIKKLREKGLGYKKIAVCLNVSANTVKSINFIFSCFSMASNRFFSLR